MLVGEHDTTMQDGQIKFGVEQVIIHPDYNNKTKFDKDFTLLILDMKVRWGKIARPVCLPEGESSTYENIKVLITCNNLDKLRVKFIDSGNYFSNKIFDYILF